MNNDLTFSIVESVFANSNECGGNMIENIASMRQIINTYLYHENPIKFINIKSFITFHTMICSGHNCNKNQSKADKKTKTNQNWVKKLYINIIYEYIMITSKVHFEWFVSTVNSIWSIGVTQKYANCTEFSCISKK